MLASCTPEDKYCLVTGLRQIEKVVAVTAGGTNDVPTMKKADVNFAMGLAGTQAVKDEANIVVLDDDFSSIIKTVF